MKQISNNYNSYLLHLIKMLVYIKTWEFLENVKYKNNYMHIFHVQVKREVIFFSADFQAIDYFSKFKWDWIY